LFVFFTISNNKYIHEPKKYISVERERERRGSEGERRIGFGSG
jgi:hypothetical protein